MVSDTLVSIIMPVYNSSRTLSKAIESVLSQTYKNWELVIADDCSEDFSREVILKYADIDSRIIPIFNEHKSKYGAADMRNKALEICTGKYIMFLDSDDIYLPEKISSQVEYMERNEIYFSYSDYFVYNESLKRVCSIHKTPDRINYSDLLKSNKIGCLTACYNCDKLGKIYMPIEAYKREDFGTWLLILKRTTAYKIPGIECVYRINKKSVSSRKLNMIKYQYRTYRKVANLTPLRALYYVFLWALNGLKKYPKVKYQNIDVGDKM